VIAMQTIRTTFRRVFLLAAPALFILVETAPRLKGG
jgi:hypothetical protein